LGANKLRRVSSELRISPSTLLEEIQEEKKHEYFDRKKKSVRETRFPHCHKGICEAQLSLWRNCMKMSSDSEIKVDSGLLRLDLKRAREVQKAFIPQNPLSIPGLECETFYRAAHGVSGDYYDFFRVSRGRWGIAIGDVSGKGMGAALVMANLQASVRAQAQSASDPAMTMKRVNQLLYESAPIHLYASLFYAEYDPPTRTLAYVNAGQNPPIVIRCEGGRSKVFRLESGGIPVGLFENSNYKSVNFQLEAEDILVACTDGIIETESQGGELWGQQRLERLFSNCALRTPRHVMQSIVREVSAFGMERAPKDDMTLVVLQVEP
jgi:phosphoserine phosphatase RsbU/P